VSDIVERARTLADEVLFPAALDVDRSGTVPDGHWQTLADEGFYALAAPPELGGHNLGLPEIVEILETLAGGCLATTFTWVQHHGVVMSLATSPNAVVRDLWVADLAAGRARGGVAFAGVVPDPPRMAAHRVEGGWRFTGDAPFVSGWGIVQVLQVSAGDVETGDVVAGLVGARKQAGITRVEPQPLVAADASRTVSLRLDDLFVPADRVVSRVPRPEFLANQLIGTRLNGTLPLGLARRCARLLDEAGHTEAAGRLRADVDDVRGRLDAGLADPTVMLAARADGARLAHRAAAALVTAGGGPSLLRTAHAQRLAREAIFTLVAASRPELKAALLDGFTDPG